MNQKGFFNIVLILVIVAIITVSGYFLFSKKSASPTKNQVQQPTQQIPQPIKNTPIPTQQTSQQPTTTKGNTVPTDVNCNDSPKYFVISRGLNDSVGSDILVKYKTATTQTIPCHYSKSEGDFEIKNEGAEYFWALADHFLILDSGTGPPPRGLIVYDLINRKKVFADLYSDPTAVNSNTVTYWSPVGTKPDETSCPKLAEYTSQGFGAEIEAHVVFTLSTLNKTELGEHRCSATQ